MDSTFNEVGHTAFEAMTGKRAKSRTDYDDMQASEGEADDRASDRYAEWIETMKLIEKAVKDAPDTKAGRRRSSKAIGKMTRQLSQEKLHEHVSEHVRDTCTTPVRAAFALITADHAKFSDALEAANSIPDAEARDIRLSKSKLREVLREFYHPSNATLADAEVDREHWLFFTRPNVGSAPATTTRKTR